MHRCTGFSERRSEEARLARAGAAAAAYFKDNGPVGADQVHVVPMLLGIGGPNGDWLRANEGLALYLSVTWRR